MSNKQTRVLFTFDARDLYTPRLVKIIHKKHPKTGFFTSNFIDLYPLNLEKIVCMCISPNWGMARGGGAPGQESPRSRTLATEYIIVETSLKRSLYGVGTQVIELRGDRVPGATRVSGCQLSIPSFVSAWGSQPGCGVPLWADIPH